MPLTPAALTLQHSCAGMQSVTPALQPQTDAVTKQVLERSLQLRALKDPCKQAHCWLLHVLTLLTPVPPLLRCSPRHGQRCWTDLVSRSLRASQPMC